MKSFKGTVKKNLKKILCLTLVAALVVGTLNMNLFNASANEAHNSTIEYATKDGIKLKKSVELLDGGSLAKIKIDVDGAEATISKTSAGSTDIVFVVDVSNTMSKDDISNVKKSIESFSVELLKNEETKVGIVLFGSTASIKRSLTSKLNEVQNALKPTFERNGGGTNTQAGIMQAKKMLAESKADNKIIVLLSDGQPTYSYNVKSKTSVATSLTTLRL